MTNSHQQLSDRRPQPRLTPTLRIAQGLTRVHNLVHMRQIPDPRPQAPLICVDLRSLKIPHVVPVALEIVAHVRLDTLSSVLYQRVVVL